MRLCPQCLAERQGTASAIHAEAEEKLAEAVAKAHRRNARLWPENGAPSIELTYPEVPGAEAPPDAEDARREAQFQAVDPEHTLDELVLPPSTDKELDAAMAQIEHYDTLYNRWQLGRIVKGKSRSLNLYGPPGTGKTVAAHGIAQRLGARIILISHAAIESKWVGETPKNLVAAFRVATREEAVLFIDEADSLLGARLSSVRQSADHAVNVARNVLLEQLSRFSGVAVFASNFAANYDPAFRRRMIAHVRFEVPDDEGRRRIWERLLVPPLPIHDNLTVDEMSSCSEGLSGSDMKAALIAAAALAARDDVALERTHLLDAFGDIRRAKEDIGHGREEDGTPRGG